MSSTGRINIAVLLSGRGTNLNAIDAACKRGDINGSVQLVIADRLCPGAIRSARKLKIPTFIIDLNCFADRNLWNQAILQHLELYQIDLVCLAGFMKILSPVVVNSFPNQILNIHPGPLPKYAGKDPQERALRDKLPETGNTVHVVTNILDDATTVLAVDHCPIKVGDSVRALSSRLATIGHQTYITAIQKWEKYYKDAVFKTRTTRKS